MVNSLDNPVPPGSLSRSAIGDARMEGGLIGPRRRGPEWEERFEVSQPSLSVCIVTQNMAHFLPFLLKSVTPIADEIVVVDSYSADETPQLLRDNPKVRLFQRTFGGHFGEQKNYAIDRAQGDWVLVMDSDEVLGDRAIETIPRLIRKGRHTHYKLARYWILNGPPWTHVRSEAHYPDFQLRLFRNAPSFRYSSHKVVHTHFPREGRGPGKKLRNCHIFHFDFILKDRQARQEKYQRYMDLEPGSSVTSRMYLYEDFPFKERRCRESLTAEGMNSESLKEKALSLPRDPRGRGRAAKA